MTVITNIEDLRVLAQKRVPRMFYDYADSGSWTEGTYRANESDFQSIKFRQRVAVNMEGRSTASKMIGQDVAMPVAIAPTGLTGMQHADGEILAAKAAKAFGIPFTLSTYFQEAMAQCVAESIAQEYNRNPATPRKVAFLACYVLKFDQRPGKPLACAELRLDGAYAKHSNNCGGCFSDDPTPAAWAASRAAPYAESAAATERAAACCRWRGAPCR